MNMLFNNYVSDSDTITSLRSKDASLSLELAQSSEAEKQQDIVVSQDELRDLYYANRAEINQAKIVNMKNGSTKTSNVYVWTYRSTACDVVSVVTTTLPVKNGDMKDIKLFNKEMRRIKPSKKDKNGKTNFSHTSPLEQGLGQQDIDIIKKKMNVVLKAEKKAFIARLNTSRYVRTTVENYAATVIQKFYRRHYIKLHLNGVHVDCAERKNLRKRITEYINSLEGNPIYSANPDEEKVLVGCHSFGSVILNSSTHREVYTKHRNKHATAIQCCFRRYISRKCLLRRRNDVRFIQRHKAAIRIQCLARQASAVQTVKLIKEKFSISIRYVAIIKMQCFVRKIIARRRVIRRRIKLRHLAARIIQNYYRTQFSKKLIKVIKIKMREKKLNAAISGMQGLARRFIARRRVLRIRLRKMHISIYRNVLKIQTLIRRFIGRRRVMRLTKERLAHVNEKKRQNQLVAEVEKDNKATDLLNKSDIFLQSKLGNLEGVRAIYDALVSQGKDHDEIVNETNFDGDTILLVASALGNMDIVIQCIQWGFNINHRNNQGLNILMIAVKHGHNSISKLLLTPAYREYTSTMSLDAIDENDGAYLLTHAASQPSRNNPVEIITLLLAQGLQVDEKVKETGCTAYHKACLFGNIEIMKLLVKKECDKDASDASGCRGIHHACISGNMTTVKLLLGIESGLGIYYKDIEQAQLLTMTDMFGKDCYIYACLGGNKAIVELICDILKKASVNRTTKPSNITWQVSDNAKVLKLIESGTDKCFQLLLTDGFDTATYNNIATNQVTYAMLAAKHGHIGVLDILLDASEMTNAISDNDGFTLFHHAATHRNPDNSNNVIAYILSHSKCAQNSISEIDLVKQDKNGNNPLHIAARCGIVMKIDLLARKGIEAALRGKNDDNLTPLLVACSYLQDNVIKSYLNLLADPSEVLQNIDDKQHDGLWHLYHPHPSAIASKRYIVTASEYNKKNQSSTVAMNMKKSDREADALRLTNDIAIIMTLLRAGCTLYSKSLTSSNDLIIKQYSSYTNYVYSGDDSRLLFEPGDVLVQEYSVTLLKNILKELMFDNFFLSKDDLWRLTLSCLKYDESNKLLLMLYADGQVAAILAAEDINKVTTPVVSATTNSSFDATATTNTNSAAKESMFTPLNNKYYRGISLAGWCIRIGNTNSLQKINKRGYSLDSMVDSNSNTCLHCACAFGTATMVDIILSSSGSIRIEAENGSGKTPLMVGSYYGNLNAVKALMKYNADGRRGLSMKYWGWLLAMVQRKEKNEKCLQWGRFGNDDETYFNLYSATKEPLHVIYLGTITKYK